MTTSVVVPLLAVTTFDAGPGWMGLLSAAAWLPWLLVGLPAGAWVDRLDHRRVMITADLAAAASTASVPVAWALGVLTLPHLAVAALLTGTCSVFFRTAYGAIVPRVVRDDDLDAANGRLYGTESAMQVAGPGLGGVLVQLVGGAMALLVDTVSFLVSAVCLWRIPAGGLRTDRAAARPQHAPRRRRGRAGRRPRPAPALLHRPGIPVELRAHRLRRPPRPPPRPRPRRLPRHRRRRHGRGQRRRPPRGRRRHPGRREGRHGPGDAVVPGPRRPHGPARRRRLTRAAASPSSRSGSPSSASASSRANVIRSAFRQRWVPPHLLGRATSAGSVVNFGTMPFAGLAAGWIGVHLGIRETILVMAALHALVSLSVLVGPYARGRDLPSGRMPLEDDAAVS